MQCGAGTASYDGWNLASSSCDLQSVFLDCEEPLAESEPTEEAWQRIGVPRFGKVGKGAGGKERVTLRHLRVLCELYYGGHVYLCQGVSVEKQIALNFYLISSFSTPDLQYRTGRSCTFEWSCMVMQFGRGVNDGRCHD